MEDKAKYMDTRTRFAEMISEYKESLLFGEEISITEIADKYNLNREPFLDDLQAVKDEFNRISTENEISAESQKKAVNTKGKTPNQIKSLITQLINRKVLIIIRERDAKLREEYKRNQEESLALVADAVGIGKGLGDEEEQEEDAPKKSKSKSKREFER